MRYGARGLSAAIREAGPRGCAIGHVGSALHTPTGLGCGLAPWERSKQQASVRKGTTPIQMRYSMRRALKAVGSTAGKRRSAQPLRGPSILTQYNLDVYGVGGQRWRVGNRTLFR